MLKKLTKVDELSRPDHWYLEAQDEVYSFAEYTSNKGCSYSPGNQLVANFKCEPKFKGSLRWTYKERAIAEVSRGIATATNPVALKNTTFIPIPPSKTKTDPDYDSRCLDALLGVSGIVGFPVDVRELVYQTETTVMSHGSEQRHKPDGLGALYQIDEAQALPAPTDIVVFDDVMTTGAHFKAMKAILGARFPGVAIRGLFVARRRLQVRRNP